MHCHGFNNFKEILPKFFRFLQSFVLIGHNHFNLSGGFQAHCDNMRKSTGKKNVRSAIPGVPSVPAAKNYYLAGRVALPLSTCRIMKQTKGCDETKMISEGEDDGFRGRGREREGKIHLNAAIVCLLNPYSGWMGLTAPQLTSTCIKPPPQLDKRQSAEQVAACSNSGETST